MSREAMKHTPGPWRLCFDGQIDGSDGRRICSFDWDSYGEFNKLNNASNARLIAAAPDLLEALCDMLEVHGVRWEHVRGDSLIPASWVELSDKARAAIAKATKPS